MSDESRKILRPGSMPLQTPTQGPWPAMNLEVQPFVVRASAGPGPGLPATLTSLDVAPSLVTASTGAAPGLGLPSTNLIVKPFDVKLRVGDFPLHLRPFSLVFG